MSAPPEVLLYARPGCHLCEDAERQLAALRGRFPHTLQTVDISQTPELLNRYGQSIPVVVVGEREYRAPLTARLLQEALRGACE